MFISFFKAPKPKRFNMPVRYYDPEKEEFEQRVHRAKLEAEGELQAHRLLPGNNIKGKMRTAYLDQTRVFKDEIKSKMGVVRTLVFVITVILIGLVFYFMALAFSVIIKEKHDRESNSSHVRITHFRLPNA